VTRWAVAGYWVVGAGGGRALARQAASSQAEPVGADDAYRPFREESDNQTITPQQSPRATVGSIGVMNFALLQVR